MKTLDVVMELKEDVAGMRTDLTRLVKTVEGNGKVGLCERINIVENSVSLISKEHTAQQEDKKEGADRKNNIADRIWIGVVLLILTTVVNIVVQFIK